jgi:hypothetical protein
VHVIEKKHVAHYSELVLPTTISINDLTIEQWKYFYELIKPEEEDITFTLETLSEFPTHTKEEIDEILSSSLSQICTSQRVKPEVQVFNNILAIEGLLESQ